MNGMITYYIVIILIIFMTILSQVGKEDNKKIIYKFFSILTACILIIVSGLRWCVGTDYGNYIFSYSRRKEEWLFSLINFDEPGIGILAKIGSFIYDDYVSMFFLVAVVTIGLCIWTISKYSNNFVFSMLIYIFIGAWHNSFNGIRQYAAAAIIFAGHRYIYDRKFLRYLLVIVCAMLFHKTALVMLPVYFVANKKITFKTILFLIIGVVIIRFSYDYLFSIMSFLKGTDQSEYAYMQSNVNPLRIAVTFAPIFVALFIKTRLKMNKEIEFYLNLSLINAILMFATSGSAYLARVGIYTELFLTLLYPRLLKFFNKDSQKIFVILVLLFYFIYWHHEVSVRDSLNNFRWIFERDF